jgi:hypothetical protein
VAASGGIALVHDPLGRLFQMSGAGNTITFLSGVAPPASC